MQHFIAHIPSTLYRNSRILSPTTIPDIEPLTKWNQSPISRHISRPRSTSGDHHKAQITNTHTRGTRPVPVMAQNENSTSLFGERSSAQIVADPLKGFSSNIRGMLLLIEAL